MLNSIKKNKISTIIWGLSLITWLIALMFLPNSIAMQYNNDGTVSWEINKYLGALIFMAIITFVYIYYMILPAIDPKKENYNKFSNTYTLIVSTILIIIYFAEVLIITSNIGIEFNFTLITKLVLALLFLVIGNYFQKIRTNWFIGFRTPWTLTNERNWIKTHRFTGRVYIVLGLLFIMFSFVDLEINWIVLSFVVLIAVVLPYVYSYLIQSDKNKA